MMIVTLKIDNGDREVEITREAISMSQKPQEIVDVVVKAAMKAYEELY